MKLPEKNRQLRDAIEDQTLRTQLDCIWEFSERELHPFQKGTTDQGFNHCMRVESNIWTLIFLNICKFSSLDLFILSASAALHDIGKIKNKKASKDVDHGELAKKLILQSDLWKRCFKDRKEAEAIAYVVSVHSSGKIELLPEEEFSLGDPPGILLRSLAAIFRLADMLDSDYRRCPYIIRSLKELRFVDEVKTWDARSSIRGWQISDDGKTILLQSSPATEEARIKTLAYVDSLNNALTKSHTKYLENCQIVYCTKEKPPKLKKDTLHFPTRFSYAEFEGKKLKEKGGLIEFYTDIAKFYISQITTIFSEVDLRGLGDFSGKIPTKLSRIFIDTPVTLDSGRAPENFKNFDSKVVHWIQEHLMNVSVPIMKVITNPELKRIVLLGDPGSGKSTIAQYACLKYPEYALSENLDDTNHGMAGIPFLVTIRDFISRKNKEPSLTLLDYISDQVSSIIKRRTPLGFVEFWLSREASLTIVDGLDEVIRSEQRRKITSLVIEFARKFPDGRFIISSRIVGYEDAPLDRNNFLHILLQELFKAQVEIFVRNWYKAREINPSIRESAIKGLLEALKEEKVFELVRNPLLLTIMALVHRGEADLPKQRALLYNKCVEAFMVSRNRAKDLLSYDEHEIRTCHQFIGYWMHTKAETVKGDSFGFFFKDLREGLLKDMRRRHPASEISTEALKEKVDEFFDAARKRVGLLVERGEDIWVFGHRSFQEYFAASYISQNTFGVEDLWSQIQDKINKSHWVEPLKLFGGIYGFSNRKGLEIFVQRILDDYHKIEDATHKRLILAGEIAGEVALNYSILEQIASETVSLFINTKDRTVMNDCKRVLNHFYSNPILWKHVVNEITKCTKAMKINASFYFGHAFYDLYVSRQFGDTRIDRVLTGL
jgi:hypothetical protein